MAIESPCWLSGQVCHVGAPGYVIHFTSKYFQSAVSSNIFQRAQTPLILLFVLKGKCIEPQFRLLMFQSSLQCSYLLVQNIQTFEPGLLHAQTVFLDSFV